MNQKEQARISVLNSVLEYQLPIAQAAEVLGVSPGHARRMLAAYRENAVAALAHVNRGHRPHNATSPAVVELATHRYEGANHTHLTELLKEREGIDLSRPTVRRILTKAGIGSPRSRRSPQHSFRRQRMPQAGILLQLDGSHHAWFEDRGPKFALLLAVDDATSVVVNAVLCISENTAGYFTLLEGLIERWGIPLALYSDRHAVFKHNARNPETAAEATQFTRSLQELGIRQIFARSPQAKGRVERAAGTFQDRLVTELRLADARTIDHNGRFALDVQLSTDIPLGAQHDVVAILSEHNGHIEAATKFNTPTPGITLSPAMASPGDTITVAVVNMPRYSSVDEVSMSGLDLLGNLNLGTDREGNAVIDGILVPSVEAGFYEVHVTVSGETVTGQLAVLENPATPTPPPYPNPVLLEQRGSLPGQLARAPGVNQLVSGCFVGSEPRQKH